MNAFEVAVDLLSLTNHSTTPIASHSGGDANILENVEGVV